MKGTHETVDMQLIATVEAQVERAWFVRTVFAVLCASSRKRQICRYL